MSSLGKIRLMFPDSRSPSLALITRRQYLNTSWLVGSPDPPLRALASSSRAIVHRFSPRFTLCDSFGWASPPLPCPEPPLPPPVPLPPPELVGGGASLEAWDVPATGNW
jgi:hypothetical protein